MMALLWRLNMSKQDLLLSHLEKGKAFTAKQIAASFGIAHPASAIRNLREQGYCVYSNPTKLTTGAEVVKYRIGKPNRRMVALANRIYGSAIFTR
jgi:predicted transcriptional regulator